MRILFVLLFVFALGAVASVDDSPPTYTLAVGPVHATEDEASSCYFNVGYGQHATMIAFHPKNMSCERAKELVGKTIRLQAVVEE